MTGSEAGRIDALTSAVGRLQGVVETMTTQWATQENHASAGRSIIHEKIDALTREVGNISSDVRNVIQDMAELKNDIDDKIKPALNSSELKAAHKDGAMWAGKLVGRLIWGLITFAAMAAGFAIHNLGYIPFHK
jgi:hypothetical protein